MIDNCNSPIIPAITRLICIAKFYNYIQHHNYQTTFLHFGPKLLMCFMILYRQKSSVFPIDGLINANSNSHVLHMSVSFGISCLSHSSSHLAHLSCASTNSLACVLSFLIHCAFSSQLVSTPVQFECFTKLLNFN